MDETTRKLVEVLTEARCALCPQAIGIAREFHMVKDPEVIARIKEIGNASVLDGPEGEFALVHVSCLRNAHRFGFGVGL